MTRGGHVYVHAAYPQLLSYIYTDTLIRNTLIHNAAYTKCRMFYAYVTRSWLGLFYNRCVAYRTIVYTCTMIQEYNDTRVQ